MYLLGEKKSADHEAAEKYWEFLNKLVEEHELSPDQIHNLDETGFFWRCLSSSTIAGTGETSALGFKQNKDRVTVLICAHLC